MESLADTEFSKLTDFQRATVDHALDRLYGPNHGTRFLVADEVGMGKTLVARGVIAGAIDRLQHEDSGVDRIDVLYICSNSNIARQNIAKLDVLGEGAKPISTRISMLATQLGDLEAARSDGRKIVNLIAFTPGTSFQKGQSGGRVAERALLFHFTEPTALVTRRRTALRRILRGRPGWVSDERWRNDLRKIEEMEAPPDPTIGERYLKLLRSSPVLGKLEELVDLTEGRRSLPAEVMERVPSVISEMRHLLARASVEALEPDLIILDEFQRFRHLLEEPEEGAESEVSQLAQDLFTYKDARVLLLSATPYKLFTLPEERGLSGDDHYRDFLSAVGFLAHPHSNAVVEDLRGALNEFRDAIVGGGDAIPPRNRAQAILQSVMARTERPTLGDAHLLHERLGDVPAPPAKDLASFVGMRRIAKEVDGQLSTEYWKSAPYFLNFMDGYQLADRVKRRADDNALQRQVKNVARIRPKDVSQRRRIEPGNARLRALQADVIDSGLHRLLWLPPSMPYSELGGDFASADARTATKRLVFSSWAAAPSAIAALLSHEALRSLEPGAGTASPRLNYDLADGRAGGMSVLLLTVPQPGLARMSDPLAIARKRPESLLTRRDLVEATAARVSGSLPPEGPASSERSPETWYWHAPLAWEGGVPSYLALHDRFAAGDGGGRSSDGIRLHLERAGQARDGLEERGSQPQDLAQWVALVGLASPANCAWRAFDRVVGSSDTFSEEAIVACAISVGEGFRTLFNRSEVMALLDSGSTSSIAYWQRVLEYCLEGNLQAVLDEYVHHLVGNSNPTNDEQLLEVATQVANAAAFGRGRVEAFNPARPQKAIRFTTRFALRYGNARGTLARDDQAADRAGDVQAAFNSPFWPFVLASTSVGQEGVDFHWWCHSLVHWNQPANVVDLEQREGRVHRFKGHAVRKNVAAQHRSEALTSLESDPWKAAFEAAAATRPDNMNELWPSWVYPGDAKVTCWVPYMPLSKDIERERRLRRDRALYRLAFGQPRQEDLLAVLESKSFDPTDLKDLRINLEPPTR